MLEYVNLDLALGLEEYKKRLRPLQQRLYELEHAVFDAKVPVIIVFEGWAATGKGRLISLLAERLDPRGKGDRLLLQAEKCEAVLSVYLACLRTGVIFLPVNPGYTLAETAHFLTDAEPALAVTDPARVAGLAALGARVMALPELLATAAGQGAAFDDPDHGPDDLAAILYTSGTTGRSKGVMLTRENLASNAEALVALWRFTGGDVLLHALPVFHTHGLFVATNCVLYSGASMIFHHAFQPAAVLAALPQATVMMGVPTFYTRLLADPGLTREVCAGVRLFISGSAPLSPATHAEWRDRTGHAILERYGMTETNMITSNPYEGAHQGELKTPREQWDRSVRVLDVIGTAAVVRVETPWFVDYFHMGRFGERWLIVNALWYSKPPPPK